MTYWIDVLRGAVHRGEADEVGRPFYDRHEPLLLRLGLPAVQDNGNAIGRSAKQQPLSLSLGNPERSDPATCIDVSVKPIGVETMRSSP